MNGVAIPSDVSAGIGGMFEGERCERCGRTDVLKPFMIEIRFGGKKLIRKARLCRKCMKLAEVGISCFAEDKWIH
ncbi:hypothetical protein [Maridesulfovibrio sp.]|uniref:hypothetical protein n=1 Tax=Maridesulfovibrio sp. TaxID=2795000 RepID=UPI0029C9D7A0|nr:hypothetical protein [Maridesulfovibrio sp.]